jgi:hypothetical protein
MSKTKKSSSVKSKSPKSKHGGTRPGAGRKKLEGMVKVLASLPESDIALLDSMQGSRQEHIRAAVANYLKIKRAP